MYNETHILCELKIWSEFFTSINIMTNQNCNKHLKLQLLVQFSADYFLREWSDLNFQSVKQESIHTMS